ncbi:hypothetical protein [Aestuariibacter sp. A3R04]|uniref:hypothetical protein n=1 Tax=Aestuariibacter sp. A3R04 TaxID=2841571 RepID=UPI001C096782|nr:hypothetical protein [Aestuariibacter sp. A3R04]MBU3020838.1 hypothetical protein [Aestuariibacter sp. A3R04]
MKVLTLIATSLFPVMALAAGSMRIDVEVYDGPLSKTLEVQKAELIGTINLTAHVLENITRAIQISECRLGCFGTRSEFGTEHPNEMIKQCTAPEKFDSEIDLLESVHKSPATVDRLFSTIFPEKDHNWFSLFPIRKLDPPLIKKRPGAVDVIEHLEFDFLQPYEYTTIPTKKEDQPHQICPQLADVKLNVLSVLNYIYNKDASQIDQGKKNILECRKTLLKSPKDTQSDEGLGVTEDCLTRIANVGKLLTEGAEHWATTHVAILPSSKRTRIAIARAAVTVAELGNEILARTDAIVRQQRGEAKAELLPTSVFLRESEGTDYLNLFEWLDATPRKSRQWPVQSRTRMIERLINDNNWSKINTAFAQGNGKTSMVFVKDDIGNWNLKNYDNDPSEMLKAYKEVGTNLLTSAAKLASGMTTAEDVIGNLAGMQQATQQAQSMLFGSSTGTQTDNLSSNIEQRIRKRIASTYEDYAARIKAKDAEIKNLESEVQLTETALKTEKQALTNYFEELDVRQQNVASARVKYRDAEDAFNTDRVKTHIYGCCF